jgi:hypothetical protein
MPSIPAAASHVSAYLRRAVTPSSGSTGVPLSPEIHRDLSRRLATVALCYAGAYLLAYGTEHVRMLVGGQSEHSPLSLVIALVSIASGILVFFAARVGKLPPASLANITLAFQVLGAVGIMGGSWGWEGHFDLYQRHVWQAIGSPDLAFPQGFVDRLVAARLRIVYLEGVTWVGVWLLIVPILVPMTPRRTLLAVLLTAGAVPAMLGFSVGAHGAPASIRPWVADLLLDTSVPTFICAAIAVFGSRAVYRLTRDLSRAQQLGSYQLVERIGVGGMGEVWRARHQLLARPAAIKLIRPDILSGPDPASSREMLRRFEREAQATAALRSPHTVELYDFGIAQDGTFYYVMEMLDGFDLKTLVERFGPVPASRAIHLLGQVCHSLEDAHRSGLVHRDVKPSNIFICRRGLDHDFVKVLRLRPREERGRRRRLWQRSASTCTMRWFLRRSAWASRSRRRSSVSCSIACARIRRSARRAPPQWRRVSPSALRPSARGCRWRPRRGGSTTRPRPAELRRACRPDPAPDCQTARTSLQGASLDSCRAEVTCRALPAHPLRLRILPAPSGRRLPTGGHPGGRTTPAGGPAGASGTERVSPGPRP